MSNLMNKRAVVPEGVILGMSIFFIIIIAFGFTMFLRLPSSSAKSQNQDNFENIQSELLLLNFVRSPTKFKGEDILVADLLVLAAYEKQNNHVESWFGVSLAPGEVELLLKQEAEKILSPYFSDKFFWGIKVIHQDKELLSLYQKNNLGDVVYTADLELPNFQDKYTIKLEKWLD